MRMGMTWRWAVGGFVAGGLLVGVTACGGGAVDAGRPSADETGTARPDVEVTSTATACTPSTGSLAAGTRVVRVRNAGDRPTELYIRRADGTVLAERETIQPGAAEDLTVEFTAGAFTLECRPGKAATAVTAQLSATGGPSGERDARLTAAVAAYRSYVLEQARDSLRRTQQLQAAVAAGRVDRAKQLYAPSRYGWESIEPVAEAFGDLDPKVDLREADLEEGQRWTGWHVNEKQLWTRQSVAGLRPVAEELVADLRDLVGRVPAATITPTSMGNGAKELLDEVATGKITGEEEAFSHTDLVDFDANLAGARKTFELLRPVVRERQPELDATLTRRFADVAELLATHRRGGEYVSYDTVSQSDRAALARAVDGLAEPLSHLAAAVA